MAVDIMKANAMTMPTRAKTAKATARRNREIVSIMMVGCKTGEKVPVYPLSLEGSGGREALLPRE
ncbi:hypothetical protein GCM10027565_14970 [Bordetella tumulicola]